MNTDAGFVKEILRLLVANGVLVEKDAIATERAFAKYDSEQFDEFLLDEDIVEKSDLLHALSQYYQVPSIDVEGYFFEHQLLLQFPKSFLLENEMIPYIVEDGNILIMIAAHPEDEDLLPAIGQHVSYDVQFYVGIARDICDAVKEFYDTSLTEDGLEETYSKEDVPEYDRAHLSQTQEETEELVRDDEWLD